MRLALIFLTMPLFVACSGGTITYTGTSTKLMFPFDGERTWTYQSTDDTIPYLLEGELLQGAEKLDGVNVYTMNYFKDCQRDEGCDDGDLLFSLRMSNGPPKGVFIHGYDPGNGNVDLSPPLLVAATEVQTESPNATTTNGLEFESEYFGQGSCQGYIVTTVEWTCHEFEIRADAELFPLTGVIQAVGGQGIVNFTFSDGREFKLLDSSQVGADGEW